MAVAVAMAVATLMRKRRRRKRIAAGFVLLVVSQAGGIELLPLLRPWLVMYLMGMEAQSLCLWR